MWASATTSTIDRIRRAGACSRRSWRTANGCLCTRSPSVCPDGQPPPSRREAFSTVECASLTLVRGRLLGVVVLIRGRLSAAAGASPRPTISVVHPCRGGHWPSAKAIDRSRRATAPAVAADEQCSPLRAPSSESVGPMFFAKKAKIMLDFCKSFGYNKHVLFEPPV